MVGGLCLGGKGNQSDPHIPEVEPTGLAGCSYSYGAPDYVLWDDVVGLTSEDCGGRKCKGWKDFRDHGTGPNCVKKKFDPKGNIVDTEYCVEYDMHPTCRIGQGCETDACKKLRANASMHPVEVGHPWWQGRCEPKLNRRRMEDLMAAFKLKGAGESHLLVDGSLLDENYQPCYRPAETQPSIICKPVPDKGGPYCYRGFSGVCQPCYVPGTTSQDPQWATNPDCPLAVLKMPEYVNVSYGPFKPPKCKTTKVKDLCCLYTKSCDGTDDPEKAELTDEGLTLVAARQNTADMKIYLARVINDMSWEGGKEMRDPKGSDAFTKLAYHSWSAIPELQKISDLKAALRDCKDCTEPHHAPAPPPRPPGAPDGGDAQIWIIIGIIGLVVVLCIGAIAFFACRKRRKLSSSTMGEALHQPPASDQP